MAGLKRLFPLLCLLLLGCPYGSPAPLDGAEGGMIEERLTGRWAFAA